MPNIFKTIIGIIVVLMLIGALMGGGGEPQRPVGVEYIPGGSLKCTYADGYVAIVKSGGCPSLR